MRQIVQQSALINPSADGSSKIPLSPNAPPPPHEMKKRLKPEVVNQWCVGSGLPLMAGPN